MTFSGQPQEKSDSNIELNLSSGNQSFALKFFAEVFFRAGHDTSIGCNRNLSFNIRKGRYAQGNHENACASKEAVPSAWPAQRRKALSSGHLQSQTPWIILNFLLPLLSSRM